MEMNKVEAVEVEKAVNEAEVIVRELSDLSLPWSAAAAANRSSLNNRLPRGEPSWK